MLETVRGAVRESRIAPLNAIIIIIIVVVVVVVVVIIILLSLLLLSLGMRGCVYCF